MYLEDKVLNAAKKGNANAFETIVKTYEKRVYGYALAKTKNRDDALDLSQEIFLKLYKSLGGFRGDCAFDTFLYRVMSTCTSDYIKRMILTDSVPIYNDDGEPLDIKSPEDVEQTVDSRQLQSDIVKAVDKLPEEQRECFILRDINGCSYEEIAVTLKIDIGTVKTRIFRARKKIKDFITENGNKNGLSKSNITKGDD